ncbi:unnamed protein product [Phytophthora fragariaefolia]|uniref:Unnamed protein product n=1 Tax=Phytophthora fragariaefolia TaxID=1490495 RepID=A0A9W7CSI8_9STRA|nr:unnamed protein product [Phytophthora fragariaefolia]
MARTTVLTMTKTRCNRRTRKPSQHEVTTGDVPDQGQDDDVQDAEQREDQDENDETKPNDQVSENSPDNKRGDLSQGDASDEPQVLGDRSGNDNDGDIAPVAALAAALQQMAATTARIDARLDQLSPAPTTTTSAPTDDEGGTQATTTTATEQPRSVTTTAGSQPTESPQRAPAVTDRLVVYQPRDDDEDCDSSGGDESSSSSDSDSDSESDDDNSRQGRRQPMAMTGDREFHRNRRPRLSGRRDWTNDELYYILGNKLQDSAARWWVQLDRKLRDRERTWTKLKSSLLRRYGERPDKSMAEWRVTQRRMMPGETYADFAAALRDLCGNNRTKEHMLLAQFYRSLDWTTRLLVNQKPRPRTLGEAVDKAAETDDPIDNVAHGMENIGQAFVTAPDSYVVPASGTTGHMAIILGVGSTDVAEDEKLAIFTNSRGVYNKYTGLWKAPKGRSWNGNMWAPIAKKRMAPVTVLTTTKRSMMAKMDKKAKVNMATAIQDDYAQQSDDGEEEGIAQTPSTAKKLKTTRPVTVVMDDGPAYRQDTVTIAEDGNEMSGSMQVQPSEESVVIMRRAVAAKVDDELVARDEGRVERYVSTVRPAMAAH